MDAIRRAIILTASFFFRELEALVRQPRLILSFVVGPVVLLGLFGIGFRGQPGSLTAILVLPPDVATSADDTAFARLFTASVTIAQVTRDRAVANEAVRSGRVNVAILVPEDIRTTLRAGNHPEFQVFYNEVDPLQATWVPFLSSLAVQDLNRRVTTKLVGGLEERVAEAAASAEQVQAESVTLTVTLEAGDRDGALAALEQMRTTIAAAGPASAFLVATMADDGAQTWDSVATEFVQIEAELGAGVVGTPRQLAFVQRLGAAAADAAEQARELSSIPPDVLTSPFAVKATNTAGAHVSVIAYYAPAVVALLLQHIAMSLVSLSMVRERLLGAMEIYRVAPVGTRHLLLGKSLSFGLVLGVLAALLLLVIVELVGVPLLGSVVWLAAAVALLVFASLGIGFLLSTVSRSEMQAVQLAMLAFLGSTIFGDFFLPIEQIWEPVRTISYLFPMTYANSGLRDVMLRGTPPNTVALVGPLLLGIVTYGLASLAIRREMRPT